ncbi:MAG: 50S ribosomal protein L18, partial [Planctomycetota bacterium]
ASSSPAARSATPRASMAAKRAAVTIASASTKDQGNSSANGGNCEGATAVGKAIAEKAVAAGVKTVRLDRGTCKYHGRVAAFADAAREGGLEF